MPSLSEEVSRAVEAALVSEFDVPAADADAVLRRSDFADFQANFAMALGKRLGVAPREVAQKVVDSGALAQVAAVAEVAGPGFVNLTVRDDVLLARLARVLTDDRLGVEPRPTGGTIVEYSSPNLAKELHVGHIRGQVIGDSLARIIEYSGDPVWLQDHFGDWGTQFGMLLELLIDTRGGDVESNATVADLNEWYREARGRFDSDPEFAERARRRVVDLQSETRATVALWEEFIGESLRHCYGVYERMGLLLGPAAFDGESRYNDELDWIAKDLEERGIAVRDDGALCVFLEELRRKDGTIPPLIVQKSDGGYGYAVTDLATIRHRTREGRAKRWLYVVDARQALHFEQVFATARLAGYVDPDVQLNHVQYGQVLGQGGTPLKTRAGDTPNLEPLIEEAVLRASEASRERLPDAPAGDIDTLGRIIGIGALKYGDLANDRTGNYVLDFDRMLALDGNTAPYLQYAHARACSILAKAGVTTTAVPAGATLSTAEERTLVMDLLELPDAVLNAADALAPHRIATYCFKLASDFTSFYEKCPVLKSEGELRELRLALVQATALVLAQALSLLGIEAPMRIDVDPQVAAPRWQPTASGPLTIESGESPARAARDAVKLLLD
ncbi:MAG: arginine--tRNA ligase [Acidimicrobiia bacterium]